MAHLLGCIITDNNLTLSWQLTNSVYFGLGEGSISFKTVALLHIKLKHLYFT